jgi:hypothetical protein
MIKRNFSVVGYNIKGLIRINHTNLKNKKGIHKNVFIQNGAKTVLPESVGVNQINC